jgi:hypothetical protein
MCKWLQWQELQLITTKSQNMTESLIIKGFWFLPNNDKERVPGTLFFIPNEEIRLELIGGLEFKIKDLLQTKLFETVHGISHEGEKITLFYCSGFGTLNFSGSFPLMNYKCKYLIKGRHLSSPSEATFSNIHLDFSLLYEWYPAGRIKYEISKKDNQDKINISIDEATYWEDVIKIDNDYSIKFFGIANFDESFDRKNFSLKQNTLFEVISTNSKKSVFDLMKKIEVFKQFLSLASLSTIEYLQIQLYDNDDYQLLKSGKKVYNPSNLFCIEKRNILKNPNRHEFLFTHNDIAEIFPGIIIKWYETEQNLAPIKNHLIESIKNKRVFTSLDFLIIIQALEGFHRRFINSDRIKLETRIKELYNLFNDVDKVNRAPLDISHVVGSRGYYSHFYEKDNRVLEGVELFNLTEQLRIILICCVIQLIGFNEDLIAKLINKNSNL